MPDPEKTPDESTPESPLTEEQLGDVAGGGNYTIPKPPPPPRPPTGSGGG